MAKSPHTPEWRAMVAQEYIAGAGSSCDISVKYGVNSKTVIRWAQRYKEQGLLAFIRGTGNTHYTSAFKVMCVELYISGGLSADEIVAKYNISDNYVLREWIKRYNANRELKDYCPKREVYMAEAKERQLLVNVKKSLNTASLIIVIIKIRQHCLMSLTARFTHGLRNMLQMAKKHCQINEVIIKQMMKLTSWNALNAKTLDLNVSSKKRIC